MKCFITRNHLRWLSRRSKRPLWWAVLLVLVDEIFLLQHSCSTRIHVCLLFVCPTLWFSSRRWKLLIAPMILLWPCPAAPNHFRLRNSVGYDPLTSSLLLPFLALLRRGQSWLWGSKLLPGSVLRNPRSCCKLSLISWFPYSYLAHILAWYPKLILSNLLQLSQLKTHPLALLSPFLFLTSLHRSLGMVSSWRWWCYLPVSPLSVSGHKGGHSLLSSAWDPAVPLLPALTLPPECDTHKAV